MRRIGAFASLPGRPAALRLPTLVVPMPLATRPVPPREKPPGPLPTRWAVQALAGPTLSYRGSGLYRTIDATATSLSQPAYSGYERPALGWGLQAQARRQLGKHWALAAGLGYHEYATQLVLNVVTYSYDSARIAAAPYLTTTTEVRQRDTYRLLTLPVQLGYVLTPQRPWQLGVLAGAEPGLYLGGRTTENSTCACQQQSFSSAANSPYNPLSVALSLGLDVRYRLGGPAGRWQLLVQPTGRYIVTPFVRGSSYLSRQPYSLGLMTGLAWQW